MPVEVVVLTWGDVLLRGERVQLSVALLCVSLLPEVVSRSLLSLRGEAPVFRCRLTALAARARGYLLESDACRSSYQA